MVSLSFHTASVLVVGDVILDRYWSGATTRVSPEAMGGQVVTLRYQEGCSTSRILSEFARVREAEPL